MIFLQYIVFTIIFSLSSVAFVQAEQIDFSKHAGDDSYLFKYQWNDINKEAQAFSFTIDNGSLFSRFRSFKTYKPKVAQNHVSKSILRRLRKEPFSDVQATFSEITHSISLRSKDQDALYEAENQLGEWQEQYLNDYLSQNNYHSFVTHNSENGIKPDHVKIAAESVELFKPFKDAILDIVEIKDVRKVSNFILGFIQSIPYSTLESRVTSSGAGYSVPTKVLWENQGDCDSKMTLTAAIMRAVMPRIDLVFVYMDNHAMLGVGIEPIGEDNYISVNGNIYVLADPTGPRLMNLGELSFESEQAINANHFSTETFYKTIKDDEEIEE
jgi:hypothetical protein